MYKTFKSHLGMFLSDSEVEKLDYNIDLQRKLYDEFAKALALNLLLVETKETKYFDSLIKTIANISNIVETF